MVTVIVYPVVLTVTVNVDPLVIIVVMSKKWKKLWNQSLKLQPRVCSLQSCLRR